MSDVGKLKPSYQIHSGNQVVFKSSKDSSLSPAKILATAQATDVPLTKFLKRSAERRDQLESHPNLLDRLQGLKTLAEETATVIVSNRKHGTSSLQLSYELEQTLKAWHHSLYLPGIPSERVAEDIARIASLAESHQKAPQIRKFLQTDVKDALRESLAQLSRTDSHELTEALDETRLHSLERTIPTILWLQTLIESSYHSRIHEQESKRHSTRALMQERQRMRDYLTTVHGYLRSGRTSTTRDAIERLAEDFDTRAPREFYIQLGKAFEYPLPDGGKIGISDHILQLIQSESIEDPVLQAKVRLDLAKRFVVDDSLNRRTDTLVAAMLRDIEVVARAKSDPNLQQGVEQLRKLTPYLQATNRVLDHVFSIEGFGITMASLFTAGLVGEIAALAAATRMGVVSIEAMSLGQRLAVGAARFGANWAVFNGSEAALKSVFRLRNGESLQSAKELRIQLVSSFFSLGVGHLAAAPFQALSSIPGAGVARFLGFSAGMVKGEDIGTWVQSLPKNQDPFLVRFYEASLNAAFLELGAKAGKPVSEYLLSQYVEAKQRAQDASIADLNNGNPIEFIDLSHLSGRAESASGQFGTLVVPRQPVNPATIPPLQPLKPAEILSENTAFARGSNKSPAKTHFEESVIKPLLDGKLDFPSQDSEPIDRSIDAMSSLERLQVTTELLLRSKEIEQRSNLENISYVLANHLLPRLEARDRHEIGRILMQQLNSANSDLRWLSLNALSGVLDDLPTDRRRAWVRIIEFSLTDNDPAVRAEAISLIDALSVSFDSKQILEIMTLIQKFIGDPDPSVRESAAETLSNQASLLDAEHAKDWVNQVLQLGEDSDPNIRQSAADTINFTVAAIPSEFIRPIVQWLIELLKNGDRGTQNSALNALMGLKKSADKSLQQEVLGIIASHVQGKLSRVAKVELTPWTEDTEKIATVPSPYRVNVMAENGFQYGARLFPITVNAIASRGGEILLAKEIHPFQDQEKFAVRLVSASSGKEYHVVLDLVQAEAMGIAIPDSAGGYAIFKETSFVLMPWNIRQGKLTRTTSRELAESIGFFDESFLSLVERSGGAGLKVEDVQSAFRDIDPAIAPFGQKVRQAVFLKILGGQLHSMERQELQRQIEEGKISLSATEDGFGFRVIPQNLALRSAEARLLATEFGFQDASYLDTIGRVASQALTVRQAREAFQAIAPALDQHPDSVRMAIFRQAIEGRMDLPTAREMAEQLANGELQIEPSPDGIGYLRRYRNPGNGSNGSGGLLPLAFATATLLGSSDAFAAAGKAILESGFSGFEYLATAGALLLLGMSAGSKGGKPRGPDTIQRRNHLESVLIDPKQPIELRCKAVKLLADRKNELSNDLLIKLLGDSKQPVQLRYSILTNLHRAIPQATHEPALKILQDTNENISLRYRALFILQQANLPELPDIVNSLLNNPRENPAFKLSLRTGK